MRQHPVATLRARSYLRLLIVECTGAFLLTSLAFLPLLLLRVLFSPGFYGLLLGVLALSLLGTVLRWILEGTRGVDVDETGFLHTRGSRNLTARIDRTQVLRVDVRRTRIVVTTAAASPGGKPGRIVIRSDGFPPQEFRTLGRRLSAMQRGG